jgi:glucose-1-phosphatase
MSSSLTQPPPIIVFDLGKVLLDFDYRIAAANLAPYASTSAQEIVGLLLDTPLLHRYERGEFSTAQFFDALREEAGFKAGFDTFALHFTNIFTPVPSMIEMHSRIRARGFTTVLLSNTNELQFHHIQKRYPFVADFNHHVLSFEHRAMKPEVALYRAVESTTGHAGSELIFLDDRGDNIEAARNLGWQAFVHESPERTAQHFHELGLLPIQ